MHPRLERPKRCVRPQRLERAHSVRIEPFIQRAIPQKGQRLLRLVQRRVRLRQKEGSRAVVVNFVPRVLDGANVGTEPFRTHWQRRRLTRLCSGPQGSGAVARSRISI